MKADRTGIDIDFRQLRIFNTVAITENMLKSSEILNLSQPSISKSISALEEEVGCKLFSRNGKKLYLNEAGKAFLEYSTNILESIDNGLIEINEISDKNPNRFLIGLVGDCSQIVSCIVDFAMTHPDVSLDINSDIDYDENIDMTNYDVIVCPDSVKYKKYAGMKIYNERYYLCVNSGHPLANNIVIATKSLDGLDYIFMKHGNTIASVRWGLKALGINIGKEYYVSNHLLQRMLIADDLGVGFVTDGTMKYYENCSDIRIVPIADNRFYMGMKICFKKHILSPLQKEFKEYILKFFSIDK